MNVWTTSAIGCEVAPGYQVANYITGGYAVAELVEALRYKRSIPDGVTGIFHWRNPSGRTMALGSTQPLTEINTRNMSLGNRGVKTAGTIFMSRLSGNLGASNSWCPPGLSKLVQRFVYLILCYCILRYATIHSKEVITVGKKWRRNKSYCRKWNRIFVFRRPAVRPSLHQLEHTVWSFTILLSVSPPIKACCMRHRVTVM